MINAQHLWFIITGIAVGILLTAHLTSKVPASSSYPFEQHEAQQELIKSYMDEQAQLKTRITSLRQELEAIQTKTKTKSSQADLDLLQQLKRELGLTEISGPGAIIEIDDSKKADRSNLLVNEDALVHASDLRDIVNALRALGVDAIAINDQRIVLSTSINGVGNTILVNNTNMLPPFSIAVVGNPEAVLSRFATESALPDIYRRVKEVHLPFKISPVPYINLPFYTGTYLQNYLKPIEG